MKIFPPRDYSWNRLIYFCLFTIFSTPPFLSFSQEQFSSISPQNQEIKRVPFSLDGQSNEYELNRMAKISQEEVLQNHKKTLEFAKKFAWKTTQILPDGHILSLQGIDFNQNPVYYITHGQVSPAACTRTNSLYVGGSLGVNLTGSSSAVKDKLGIWDGGLVRSSHQEIGEGRIKQIDSAPYLNDHATHLAGILIGKGVNKLARGMAYGANLKVWDFGDDISEMSFAAKDLLVSNHSYGLLSGWVFNPDRSGFPGRDDQYKWEWWGDSTIHKTEDYKFGFYDKKTSDLDRIANLAPYYLIVKSADNKRNENGPPLGIPYYIRNTTKKSTISRKKNDGFDTIPTDGNAKNILTIGAIDGGETVPTQPSEIKMSAYSSWGPTDDGRIKPDLVGAGDGILSASANADDTYMTLSGTSVAAPNVSGSLLLLQEFYAKNNFGYLMRSSTLKGLVLHSANEAGTSAGPDYKFGWGLLNIERAAQVIANQNQNHIITEKVLFQNSNHAYQIVASGKSPLVITLAWNDPEGTPTPVETQNVNNRTPKLVNDLDMRLLDGKVSNMPWTLDPNFPEKDAQKGDNFRDNIEQIVIEKPEIGKTYTLNINHKGESLKGNLQNYSLIISGLNKNPCHVVASISARSNPILCGNTPVKLLANTGTGYKYVWYWNGQEIPNSNVNYYDVTVAGRYTVSVQDGSCKTTSPAINVQKNTISVSIVSGGGTVICGGNTIRLSTNFDKNYKYEWLRNGNLIANANASETIINQEGSYTVKITQNQCTSVSRPFLITAGNISSETIPTGKIVINSGQSSTIQAVTNAGLYQFQWLKNNQIIPNATRSTISISQEAVYTLRVTSNKCVANSLPVELSFKKKTNREGAELVVENDLEALKIYPNPSHDVITLEYISHISSPIISVQIFNNLGVILYNQDFKTSEGKISEKISLHNFQNGLLHLRILDEGNVLTSEIIKIE
jgi:Subtilase family/Secretion system C-terminal sorting domain